ncbi:MAG: hypothetical protein C0200_06290 [Thermoproteota archaeon]|nr:MAG: hypothetical protein C0200_06290 [Candidatus Korarchaeota archaeon]
MHDFLKSHFKGFTMGRNELIDLMRALGLSSYEAKAYTALLLHGPLTSTELASHGGIPQPRVYDIIRGLVEKGLVQISHGRPKKFSAISPEVALKNYVMRRNLKELEIYSRVIDELKSTHIAKEEIGVWTTLGIEGALSLTNQALQLVENELLIAAYTDFLGHVISALKRDISTCLVLYDVENRTQELQERVDELRFKPTHGPIIVIPDMMYVLVIAGWNEGRPTSYKVTDDYLKRLLMEYFLGYLRGTSKLVSSRMDRIFERRYVHLVRAVDHIRALQSLDYDVRVLVEGRWTKTGEHAVLSGRPIRYVENSLKGIESLILRTDEGIELSVGGLGAHLEDFEAIKLAVKAKTRD